MSLKVPVTNDARQTFTTTLEGQNVRLTIWYQDDGTGWYITISIVGGEDIVNSARLNSSTPVLFPILSEFAGDFVPVPAVEDIGELGRNPWDNTYDLVYFTEAELKEAGLV